MSEHCLAFGAIEKYFVALGFTTPLPESRVFVTLRMLLTPTRKAAMSCGPPAPTQQPTPGIITYFIAGGDWDYNEWCHCNVKPGFQRVTHRGDEGLHGQ